MVMLSTAIYPAFSGRPAAFARSIATAELRSRLGFQGVSITDALDTVAVRRRSRPKAGLAAARAGTDLLLFTDLDAAEKAQQRCRQPRPACYREDFEASAPECWTFRRLDAGYPTDDAMPWIAQLR